MPQFPLSCPRIPQTDTTPRVQPPLGLLCQVRQSFVDRGSVGEQSSASHGDLGDDPFTRPPLQVVVEVEGWQTCDHRVDGGRGPRRVCEPTRDLFPQNGFHAEAPGERAREDGQVLGCVVGEAVQVGAPTGCVVHERTRIDDRRVR